MMKQYLKRLLLFILIASPLLMGYQFFYGNVLGNGYYISKPGDYYIRNNSTHLYLGDILKYIQYEEYIIATRVPIHFFNCEKGSRIMFNNKLHYSIINKKIM